MSSFLAEILKTVAQLVLEIISVWTGEIILWLVTLGRHKPRWDFYTRQSSGEFVLFSEVSAWIGLIFWFSIGFLVCRFLWR